MAETSFRRTLLLSTTALFGVAALPGAAWGQPAPNTVPVVTGNPADVNGATVIPAVPNGMGGNDLVVTVNNQRAVITWQSFNIGSASQVNFTHGGPSIDRFVLNRDLSGAMSQVYGSLTSDPNISVYVMNPTGVVFGPSANVNVGSLIAGSLDISPGDFLAGGPLTFSSAASGQVQVLGGATLNATGDQIALLGSVVTTAAGSSINANGNVAIVAATDVTLSEPGSPMSITINQGSVVQNAVVLGGDIEGRNIYVATANRNNAVAAVLNAGGTLTATGAAVTDRGVVLTAGANATDVTVAAGNAESASVNITGTVDSAAAVEVRALTNVTVNTSLGAAADRQIDIAGGAASGTVRFNGPTQLTADTNVSAANVRFTGAVDSAAAADLSVSAGASTRFEQAVGAADALGSVMVTGTGTTTVSGGTVRTNGAQSYAGQVTLGADATFASLGNGDISFGGPIGGQRNLVVNTGGVTRFDSTVSVASLTTDQPGSTRLAGGTVLTSGNQTYNDAVVLEATTSITSNAGGTITFNDTIDGAETLTVETSGTSRFNGVIGGAAPLDQFNTTGGGRAIFTGGAVNTTNGQSYNSIVDLRADTIMASSAGGDIQYLRAVEGLGRSLTVNTAGQTGFNGVVVLGALTTDASGGTRIRGGTVIASGDVNFADNVVIDNLAPATGTTVKAANITFGGTVGGGQALNILSPGTTRFGGAVTLSRLDTGSGLADASLGRVEIAGGTITTTGIQIYNNDVVLAADTILTSTGAGAAGNISFNAFVDGGFALTVTSAGTTSFFSRVGAVAPLASLTVNGGGATRLAGLTVNTTGNQTYTDDLLLTGNLTLTGATPTFGGDVTGDGSNLTLNFSGDTRISGTGDADATDFTGIRNLATGGGGTTILSGTIVTSGSQVYNDDLRLAAATTLQGAGATIGAVDGNGQDLTLNFSGTVTLDGDAITQVDDFVTGNGGTTAISGTLTTLGAQTHNDNLQLIGDTVLASSGNADLTLSRVIGAFALAVNTTGVTRLTGAVGGGAGSLTTLTTDAGGTTLITGAAVTTTGDQTYNDDVQLGADTFIASTGGNLVFNGTVSSAGADRVLTVSAFDTTRFDGAVGTLGVLNASGNVAINGGSVTTSAAQTYLGAVRLGADAVLQSTGGGAISFVSTVDGAGGLEVRTAGTTTFSGSVGDGTQLAFLTTDAGGGTRIGGPVVRTAGDQSYGDDLLFTAPVVTLAGAAPTFGGTVRGSGTDLTLTFAGDTRISGSGDALAADFTGFTRLTTNGGGRTVLSGSLSIAAQIYNDLVVLAGDTSLNGVNSTFSLGVDGNGFDGTSYDLALNLSGDTIINGSFVDINDLSTGGGGITRLSGAIITTGNQTYNDAVVLANDATLDSSGNGDIAFQSTVDGGFNFIVSTGGTTTFTGAVGSGTPLLALRLDGGGESRINGGLVDTTGDQLYFDTIRLGNDTLLRGATPTLVGSFIGDGFDLLLRFSGTTLISGTGDDIASDFTGIRNLESSGGGLTRLAGTIETTGSQTYNDDVELLRNTTLTSGGGDVSFAALDSAAGAARSLVINSPGNTFFGGEVGAVRQLGGLTTDAAGTAQLEFSIRSTSTTINDPLDLVGAGVQRITGGDVTLASSVNAFDAAGTLSINTLRGGVFQSATFAGRIAVENLAVNAGAVSFAGVDHSVGALAVSATSGFTFLNDRSLVIGSVDGVNGLTATGAASDVQVRVTGTLGSTHAISVARDLILVSTGAMTLGADVTAGRDLTVNGAGVTTTLAALQAGGVIAVDADDGAAILGSLNAPTAISIFDASNVTLSNVTTGLFVLGGAGDDSITGNVTQNGGTNIDVGTLTGNVAGDVVLANTSNLVGTLGAFNAANLSLRDNAGGMLINGNVTVPGRLVFSINGALTQVTAGGIITTGDLFATTVGGARLESTLNAISLLSGFTNVGGGGVRLNNFITLRIADSLPGNVIVDAGTGELRLSGRGIDFTGEVLRAGGNLELIGVNALGLAGAIFGNELRADGAISAITVDNFIDIGRAIGATNPDGAAASIAIGQPLGGLGTVSLGEGRATGLIFINAAQDARIGTLTSLAGDVSLVSRFGNATGLGGAPQRGDITAANNITVNAAASVLLNNLRAGGHIRVNGASIDVNNAVGFTGAPESRANLITMTASNGPLTLGTGRAATDILLTATNGLLTLNFGDALGNILLDGNQGTITGTIWEADGRIDAQGDLGVTVGIATALGGTVAANTILLQSASGGVTLDNGVANGNFTLDAATDVRVGTANSIAGNVSVLARSGSVTGLLDGGGAPQRGDLFAGSDVIVDAATNVLLNNIMADGNVTVNGASIDVNNVVGFSGAPDSRANLITMTASNGSLTLGTGRAVTDINLTATNGTLLLFMGDALGNILLDGNNGSIQGAVWTAGGRVDAQGDLAVLVGTVSALGGSTMTNTILLRSSGGEIILGSGDATGNITIEAATDVEIGQATSIAGNIDIDAGGEVVGLQLAPFENGNLTTQSGGGDIDVLAGSVVRLGSVNAGGNIEVDSTGGGIDITDGRAAGTLDLNGALDVVLATGLAGGNATLVAGSDARIGTLTSGGAIDIRTGRDVLGTAADGRANLIVQGSGTDIAVTAGRDALLNTVTARRDVAVNANRLAGLGTTTGVNIRVNADNLDLTGIATATTLIELTNRAASDGGTSNDTFFGDGTAPATAFALTQIEVNRLSAPVVNLLSGAQNVGIGSVQLADNVGATNLRLLGTGRFDVFGTLQAGLVANRTIQIGGSNIAADQLTPANLSNAAFVQANLANAIVIRIAGTNGGALLLEGGTLDLRGQRIAAGNAGNLLTDLGLIGAGPPLGTQDVAVQFVSQPSSSLYFEPAGGLPPVFLRADNLSVTYSEFAVFQNTAIGVGGLSSGAVIGGRVPGQIMLNTTGSGATNTFALFGEINDQIASGAALLGEPPLFISTTNLSNTRINGCLVGSGGGGCLITALNPPRVETVREDQVNILTAEEAALQVDPLVGTSNEALLTDCEADPTAEQCPAEDQP